MISSGACWPSCEGWWGKGKNGQVRQTQNEQELEQKATHDSLTGLPHRSLLDDRIHQSVFYAMRSKRIVAVLLLDLDRFKIINDALGHKTGDRLLVEVTRRLAAAVRECDTVARFGGDEFVVVLAEIAGWRDIGIVTEKILENLLQPGTAQGTGAGTAIG